MKDMTENEVRDLFTEMLKRSSTLMSITVKCIKGPDIELSIMKYTGSDDDALQVVYGVAQPRRLDVTTSSREACINWLVTKLEDRARSIVACVDDPKRCNLILLRHAVIDELEEDGESIVYMRIYATFAIVEPGRVETHEVLTGRFLLDDEATA